VERVSVRFVNPEISANITTEFNDCFSGGSVLCFPNFLLFMMCWTTNAGTKPKNEWFEVVYLSFAEFCIYPINYAVNVINFFFMEYF
jgi:hypothetical protein